MDGFIKSFSIWVMDCYSINVGFLCYIGNHLWRMLSWNRRFQWRNVFDCSFSRSIFRSYKIYQVNLFLILIIHKYYCKLILKLSWTKNIYGIVYVYVLYNYNVLSWKFKFCFNCNIFPSTNWYNRRISQYCTSSHHLFFTMILHA